MELAQMLLACAETCDNCYQQCLQEENVQDMVKCIELDRDCSDVCRLTAAMIDRDSIVTDAMLKACAAICRACADECAKHGMDHCQECAEECRHCAQECVAILQ